LLVATIGPTYFALSATGPLVQSWFAAVTPTDDPRRARVYRLFAVSNLASLLALVAYPFAIEPFFSIRQQVWAWSIVFGAFAALCALSAVLAARAAGRAAATPTPPAMPAAAAELAAPTLGRHVLWLLLSALGCGLLVAVSTHITQNVASVPFLWILPLATYLLTFILCFDSERWYHRGWFTVLVMLMLPLMAWGLFASGTVLPFGVAVPLYGLGLFVACMFCHGELASARPAPEHLTRFYLMVAAGGAAGGLLVGLAAPRVFDAYWEQPILLVLVALMVFVLRRDRSWRPLLESALFASVFAAAVGWWVVLADASPFADAAVRNAAIAALGVALILGFMWRSRSRSGSIALIGLIVAVLTASLGWTYRSVYTSDVIAMDRNFYGTVRVSESSDGMERRLNHGVILHGQQFLDVKRRGWPTTYYSATSGAGVAMAALRADRQRPLRVGLIGLGVGTLAAWGEQGDALRFYEINPQVIALARGHFTYLSDSRATISTALGDARLVLEREAPQGFDLIVVDAFTSDAVPVHLMTREAMAIYARHLAPGGIVAFHVSNLYLDLAPVVAGIAAANGMSTVRLIDEPEAAHVERTIYVIAAVDPTSLALPPIAARAEAITPTPGSRPWTDDYNYLLEALLH
jgi:hypothetical protein